MSQIDDKNNRDKGHKTHTYTHTRSEVLRYCLEKACKIVSCVSQIDDKRQHRNSGEIKCTCPNQTDRCRVHKAETSILRSRFARIEQQTDIGLLNWQKNVKQ